ncbi:ribosome silencing factor [Thiohalophilus sp.]|uniref:ribosome silencing factor n=1 Tax=Thiohalophilus sp. TaxID=3028392 RepID=UPI002ACD6758|nr:ribosome silencing factor [Thiohalophilus sp.]MDZ7804138.1 ribosome silencing factor [Thiohalophilus sp.]
MNGEQLKQLVVEAIEDVKGIDVKVLDVSGQSNVTDVMVIASGNTARQVKAIADNIIEKAKAAGIKPMGVEGEQYAEWVLVDLGDVVAHIMQPSIRDFYNLEKLWGEASPSAVEK